MAWFIFWGAFVVLFLWAAAWESIEIGVVVLAAYLLADWWYDYGLTIWVWNNLPVALMFLAAYAAAGGVWSLVKWRLWLRSQEDGISKAWNTLKASKGSRSATWLRNAGYGSDDASPDPTEAELAEWREEFKTSGLNLWAGASNKKRITAWIAWWPASIVWTVANDVILELWNWVYSLFVGLYDRISASVINRNLK